MKYSERNKKAPPDKPHDVAVPRTRCACIDGTHAHHKGTHCTATPASDSKYCEPCAIEKSKPKKDDWIRPDSSIVAAKPTSAMSVDFQGAGGRKEFKRDGEEWNPHKKS